MAAVSFCYPGDDSQTEANTAHLATAIGLQSKEWPHHFVAQSFRNTGAIIVNG